MHAASQSLGHLRESDDLPGQCIADDNLRCTGGRLAMVNHPHRRAGILVEIEPPRFGMKYRLARLEGFQYLNVIVPLKAAGRRAPGPLCQYRVERLDLHDQLVPFREQELGLRRTRRSHLGQL